MKLWIGLPTLLTVVFSPLVLANVEKTIFVAPPPPVHVYPSLDDLGLDALAPENPLLRTGLNASFPESTAGEVQVTGEESPGEQSWFLLQDLSPGTRYEVRVCWLATVCLCPASLQVKNRQADRLIEQQPTSFTLSTYTMEEITSDKAALAAISRFSNARLASLPEPQRKLAQSHQSTQTSKRSQQSQDENMSVLFLRVDTVADYFTLSEPLMQTVPPVPVDLILDPFLGNVFPRSLVSTACWGLVVAAVAVGISRWVVKEIGRVVLQEMRVDNTAASNTQKKKA